VVAYVALSVTERALRSRVESQIQNAAALVSQSDFALNPAILRSVKAVTRADIVTYSASGRVEASTFDSSDDAAHLARVVAAGDARVPTLQQLDCGVPCYVAYRRVAARPDTTVAVVAETSELQAATRTVTRTIVGAAIFCLLLIVLVSQLVAQRVTAPLNDLVRFTRTVAAGERRQRASSGDDEIGRLGAAFNDMLDRLEQSQSALVKSEKLAVAGLVSARAAHDIRNPLSSIKMQTQLLRAALRPVAAGGRRDADLKTGEILDAVLRDIAQVEVALRDLLELARPGELDLRSAELPAVVCDVLSQLRLQLTHRKIAVRVDAPTDLPTVRLDVERFRQALVNVVNNAADAMATGGALDVVLRRGRDGATIELDVCDDGVGIDADIADRVFDPFVSTKRHGVGLGLVNAKAVLERHGGGIALEARAPRGTRATLWLPTEARTDG
jgi:signal transduction histidine kinase